MALKVQTFVVAVALLCTFVKATDTSMAATHTSQCKRPGGMWGDVDPNIFYLCDAETDSPLQFRCPEGRGFFHGLGYSGCIPYEDWPACIATGITNPTEVCDIKHLQQPWEAVDPHKFYLCQALERAPVLVNCEAGKGFVSAMVGTENKAKIVGCARWEKWRSYMHCEAFY